MIVESLAVTHRPNTILALVGQPAVSAQVKGMVKSGKFPSAILLSGSSGCGKTTTSRLIALMINCSKLDKQTLEPCGECPSCKLGSDSPDYMEVNVGDTRGIDDIRAIAKSAQAMPMISHNRVIVLDEVHALLGPAANALLKSLEDTPKRTLWILATTNPEKLLPTIVGRCTKLNLTSIDPDAMAKRLRIISKREGVDLKALEGGDAIVRTIVSLSNGQMRDAISLLESALFSMKGSKTVDAATVLKNFTTTGEADLERKAAELLIAILSQDIKTIIKISRQTQGTCRGILSKLRWLIQYSLDNAAGIAKYKPYGAKVFSELLAKNKVKCGLRALIGVQSLLVDIEERFNRMSVDESVVFLSMLSDFSLSLEGN